MQFNDATRITIGDTDALKVYLGRTQVWPRVIPEVIRRLDDIEAYLDKEDADTRFLVFALPHDLVHTISIRRTNVHRQLRVSQLQATTYAESLLLDRSVAMVNRPCHEIFLRPRLTESIFPLLKGNIYTELQAGRRTAHYSFLLPEATHHIYWEENAVPIGSVGNIHIGQEFSYFPEYSSIVTRAVYEPDYEMLLQSNAPTLSLSSLEFGIEVSGSNVNESQMVHRALCNYTLERMTLADGLRVSALSATIDIQSGLVDHTVAMLTKSNAIFDLIQTPLDDLPTLFMGPITSIAGGTLDYRFPELSARFLVDRSYSIDIKPTEVENDLRLSAKGLYVVLADYPVNTPLLRHIRTYSINIEEGNPDIPDNIEITDGEINDG